MYLQTHEKKILNFKNSRSYIIVIDFLNTYDYKKLHKFINEHNEFLAKKYIDPIRAIVNPLENDRYLDEQQLLSISKRVRNNLLIAGAGSGKTTTIIGLVKLLIKMRLATPNEILLLSFTRATVKEMKERLYRELAETTPNRHSFVQIETFHSLGKKIIESARGSTKISVYTEISTFVQNQLKTLLKDKNYIIKIWLYTAIYSQGYSIDETCFQNPRQYEMYLKKNPPTTLNGEIVKSYGELEIANFLHSRNINYKYEEPYKIDTATSEYSQYKPDFYLPDYDVYIEYFGIDENNMVAEYFDGDRISNSKKYMESIEWKRKTHADNNTRMIELYYYQKKNNSMIPTLIKSLYELDRTILMRGKYDYLLSDDTTAVDKELINGMVDLFSTSIIYLKNENLIFSDIINRNNQKYRIGGIDLFLELLAPIYKAYEEMLRKTNMIDFSDMLNLSRKYINNNRYMHNYKYVIIDEYQDISSVSYSLLKAMRNSKDYNLFAVGDDWQSIYGFSGSNINYLLNFEKYWGHSAISKINTTYRFPQTMCDISSKFIIKNPNQLKKYLKSIHEEYSKSLDKVYIENLLHILDEIPIDKNVLFLGRYNSDIDILNKFKEIDYKYNPATKYIDVFYKKRRKLKIQFMTIHRSKGLESDYTVVLNLREKNKGFPSTISDAPIFKIILEQSDDFCYAEERRLFYVALTRAKVKTWLLLERNNISSFVYEISKISNDINTSVKSEQ